MTRDRGHDQQQRPKPAALTTGPSSQTASELTPIDTVEPHAGDARAHAVIDVAHDHRVGERDRAEDRRSSRQQQRSSHQPWA